MEKVLYACLVLLPFGISLRMSLRLLYGARGPQVGDPIYQVVNTSGWALTILPLLVFVVVGTNWLSWFVLAITAIAGVEFILARRSMQRLAAWELLTGAIGGQKPAIQALQNHQGRFTGLVGRAFRKLVAGLQKGVPLPQAIGDYRSALPEIAQAYAAMDGVAVTGPGSAASQEITRQGRDSDALLTATAQQLSQRYAYLATLLAGMVVLITFFMIKIIPSYEAIFQDFALELPPITVWLIALSSGFTSTLLGGLIVLVLVVCLLCGLLVGVLYLCDVHALRPITDRLFFARHRTQVLRMLAIAAERGQSFESVLQALTEGKLRYPSRVTVARLKRAHQQMKRGVDWKYALQAASILRSADLPMLETAQHAGNLPWVLRMLADQKTRSMVFRWAVIEQVVFPLQVAALGFVVLFVCVALFLPLVMMINGLTL